MLIRQLEPVSSIHWGIRYQHELGTYHLTGSYPPPAGSASGGGSAFFGVVQDVSGSVAYRGFFVATDSGFVALFGAGRASFGIFETIAPATLVLVLVGVCAV